MVADAGLDKYVVLELIELADNDIVYDPVPELGLLATTSNMVAVVAPPLPVTELIEAPVIDALKSPVTNSVFGMAVPNVSTNVLVDAVIGAKAVDVGATKDDTVIALLVS